MKGTLAFFIPHAGCPHACSFCAQRSITGQTQPVTAAEVVETCRQVAGRPGGVPEQLAFFGGSFTAIARAYMLELLEAAFPFVENGTFAGIRISTRPDCVDTSVLRLLRRYGVQTVELGAQSMCDRVLERNGRGHTAADTVRACGLLHKEGLTLGLQMMTGLDGASEEEALYTARRLAALGPAEMRVYPTVVIRGSDLEQRWQDGTYRPQTLEEAVTLGARLLTLLEEEHGIPVIRMGLHAQETLARDVLAGPYHPALRELCEGALLRERIAQTLEGYPVGKYHLRVSPRAVSKITGHGARTIENFAALGYNIKIKPDALLTGRQFRIEEV